MIKPKKTRSSDTALKMAKKDAIKAAKELGYVRMFENVEETINNAITINQISNIMCNYRKVS